MTQLYPVICISLIESDGKNTDSITTNLGHLQNGSTWPRLMSFQLSMHTQSTFR